MSREDRITVALYAANRRMAVELVLWLLALPGAPTEESLRALATALEKGEPV